MHRWRSGRERDHVTSFASPVAEVCPVHTHALFCGLRAAGSSAVRERAQRLSPAPNSFHNSSTRSEGKGQLRSSVLSVAQKSARHARLDDGGDPLLECGGSGGCRT
jgi:hypothetical protein